MDNLRPGQIALLAGGVVLFISTFLDWNTGTSGISTDFRGLQGIVCLVIGALIVVLVAVKAFGGNDLLPNGLLGFTTTQLYVALGFAAFVITFGAQFSDSSKFGVLFGWIGAAAIVVGGMLEDKGTTASTAPTPF